jgi:hypothetical protein
MSVLNLSPGQIAPPLAAEADQVMTDRNAPISSGEPDNAHYDIRLREKLGNSDRFGLTDNLFQKHFL